ncbi:MAG: response regulator [Burkholderiales bacterium]|nr:response regulator [Burkholderiales bacterium]
MHTSKSRSLPCLDGAKVLIVDDNAYAREALEIFFGLMGAQVKQAASGEQGLVEWKAWDPSVVLSDIGMPGLDGYEFIRALRIAEREQGRPYTPAVAITAYAQERDKMLAREAGFDVHVAKPADPMELTNIVTELLRISRPLPH